MRGSIIKRKGSQNYSIVLDSGKDASGKRHQQWIVCRGGKRDAEKELARLLHEVDQGLFVKPGKLTVRDHLTQWLDSYVAISLSPRTLELYRYIVEKHILPRLGNIQLSQLSPQAVQSLYSEKVKTGLSNRTVQIIHNILHKCLENAVKTGILGRNPLTAVECPKVKRKEMSTLNEGDIQHLLSYSKDTDLHALWYTLIFTGLRRGEALSLRWSDIDLPRLKVQVKRTMQYLDSAAPGKKIIFKEPKTSRSRRYISIAPSNAAVLREHCDTQNRIRQSLGLPLITGNDLVFSHYDGTPLLPNSVTHAWIKLARRCGLSGRRLHDCRHSYATILLRQNVHPSVVASQLGHASVKTTLDIYSHAVPQLQELAAGKFEDMVLGNNRLPK